VACVLCASEAASLLELRKVAPAEGHASAQGRWSVDLGFRHVDEVLVVPSGIALPGEAAPPAPCVTWDELERIVKKKDKGAWRVFWGSTGYAAVRVESFSEATSRSASLLPVDGAPPTAVLSGFGMHRFAKDCDPADDTQRKLQALQRKLRGCVLDVCTGLGYTAIGAAAKEAVQEVVTIELDPVMVEMQRSNPWSAELFENDKITRLLGDATHVLPTLEENQYDAIIHDPPAQALSGELYSAEIYAQFARVLKPSGMLYHYIGDPSSKASGTLFKGISERLKMAGLSPKTSTQAYGITATFS